LALPASCPRGGDATCALSAPGPALSRRPASLPARAAPGFPRGATPGRRLLPLPPRDDGCRHASRGRPAVRRICMATAGRARRRAERPARPRRPGVSTLDAFDRYNARLVHRTSGMLRAFNEAGVLAAADIHVALRLGRLAQVEDESTLLA